MGGLFGVVGVNDVVEDLFYGTDYHSHLGTKRGGLAAGNGASIVRYIHNIENAQFRSKFGEDVGKLHGNRGIGVISDYEDQPLLIRSHLGNYAIATVGVIKNIDDLVARAFRGKCLHFSEMRGGEINPTELVAAMINREDTFEDGIRAVWEFIRGSSSLLILTDGAILAARDKLGRTPLILGKKPGSFAVSMETCAFPNLDYEIDRCLGPGEIVRITADGVETLMPARDKLQICSFLWVYYGYPASSYEGINVETVRNRCGAYLARNDDVKIDLVAGIPDSGIGHGLGYAAEAGIPFRRPFVKYTPTWARSFMPQHQDIRDQVARMKLIPIHEIIRGHKLLFCEDSIVRGTQLKDTIQRLYASGAVEVHMRPACPPLAYGCKYLNFSRSRTELDLAARKAVAALEGPELKDLRDYTRADSDRYRAMVDWIARTLSLTTLRYQRLEDLVSAIGLPKSKLCTYCWDGVAVE
ncbi:MAG TPA: amidophosphoribosyltransferase [Candidatus Aminicenantes bacterium]|nr:amidophosphoribosyltransferase [Candidatus Aminicenantes bacterium]HRY65229.1 amidophosphoribosyltransferase [Candidatus Aminicenantes bacterium]HRZ72303.1 amidophosphoribosyltransferase [Candidatus Aminicenantes bacterium]